MSKKLTQNEKATLGVMWTLLNTTTKYNWDIENVIEVMKIIRKTYPHADKMWVKEFKICQQKRWLFSFSAFLMYTNKKPRFRCQNRGANETL